MVGKDAQKNEPFEVLLICCSVLLLWCSVLALCCSVIQSLCYSTEERMKGCSEEWSLRDSVHILQCVVTMLQCVVTTLQCVSNIGQEYSEEWSLRGVVPLSDETRLRYISKWGTYQTRFLGKPLEGFRGAVPLSEETRLKIFGSPDLCGFSGHSFEWWGLRVLTWKPVCNFGVSRENVFDMYGDSREIMLEILAVVIILSLIFSVRGVCCSGCCYVAVCCIHCVAVHV